MTLYQKKSFTVPASSEKSPENCKHGWRDKKGKCVMCGDVPKKDSCERSPK